MAWIELHDTLPDHDKVLDVSEALKMDKDMVVGKLVRLWTWALNNREDGIFKARDIATIAEIMRYKGKPKNLVDALVRARLLDQAGDAYVIHDWDERVGMLLAKLETAIQSAGDNAALKQELENLKTTNQTNMDNLKNEYESKLKTAAVMAEITKAGANDPADILPHIDLSAVTTNDKGCVGLSEQLESIKTAKPYLFKVDNPAGQRGASGLQHGAGGDDTAEINKMRAVMGLPPIKNK